MNEDLRQKLTSGKQEDREEFLRVGALIDEPSFCLIYNSALSAETYSKTLVTADARFYVKHTAPVSLLLGTERYRIWELRGEDARSLLIAYDPAATEANKWWEALRSVLQGLVPRVNGDMVLFRFHRPLTWTPIEVEREVMNFLVARYGSRTGYKFSF